MSSFDRGRFRGNGVASSIVTCLALLLAFHSLSALESTVDRVPAEVRRAFRSISASECRDHVRILSSDRYLGRAAGEEGGRLASEYVAAAFAAAGIEAGGVDGSWFQPFPILGKKTHEGPLSDTNFLTLADRTGSSRRTSLLLDVDYLLHPLSAEGRIDGLSILIGDPDREFVGSDFGDRVVLLPFEELPEGSVIERLSGRLSALGSTALLLVPLDPASKVDSVSSSEWQEKTAEKPQFSMPVVLLSGAAGRKLWRASSRSIKVHQRGLAKKPGGSLKLKRPVISMRASHRGHIFGQGRNVIGVWRGKDPKLREEFIVVGAHYDHLGTAPDKRLTKGTPGKIHNGADDNASGTAGLIELAEAFSEGKIESPRSIVFIAFDAEELGLVGSAYYVNRATWPIEKTRAMLNMDMISRNDPKKMYVARVEAYKGLNEILERTAGRFGILLDSTDMEQYLDRSDQGPFLKKGIPATFLFGGMHPQYHTENDDLELINPQKIENVARLMFLATWECARYQGSFLDGEN